MNPSQASSRRTFLGERLLSFAGYLCPPVALDALQFFLPPFRLASSRVVLWKAKVWEFWSPNSPRLAYYPGVRDPQRELGHNLPPHLRRADGHLGRFDPTVSPQHYDPARPWLGFIRRLSDESRPEYRSFLLAWQATAPPNRGFVRPSFVVELRERAALALSNVESWSVLATIRPELWHGRVSHPNEKDVDLLGDASDFETALELCTRIQRGIKSLTAWSKMASTIITDHQQPARALEGVPAADESMMGVWLNGCTEEEGMWLMRYKVPCFIVHEAVGLNDDREALSRVTGARKENFVMDTLASTLHSSINSFDMAILLDGGRLVDLESDIGLGRAPVTSVEDRERSSAFRQGWFNGRYVGHQAVPGPSPRFAAPAPSQVGGRIIPPPVIDVAYSRPWSKWNQEWSEELGCYLQARGKGNRDPLGDYQYYDRQNGRWLFLDEPLAVPSLYEADPQIFGLPAPVACYMERENNKDLAERRASTWVYFKERPARNDVGRVYVPPAQVPYLSPPLPSASQPAPAPVPLPAPAPVSATSPVASPFCPTSPPPVASGSRIRSSSPMDVDAYLGPYRRSPSPAPLPRYDRNRHYSPPRCQGRSPVLRSRHSSLRSRSPRRRSFTPVRSRERYRTRTPSPKGRQASVFSRRLHSRSSRRCPSSSHRSSSPRSRSSSRPRRRSRPSRSPSPYVARRLSLSRRLRSPPQDDAAPASTAARGLLDRLDSRPAIVTSSGAEPDLECLASLFPAPTSPGMPVLKSIGTKSVAAETRYLIIWNLPVYYVWVDVVAWIRGLPVPLAPLRRVLRSNEDGHQVFWFVFANVESAERFRGVVSDRRAKDTPHLKCDFVNEQQYSSAAGHSVDAWNPSTGFENEIDAKQPFGGNLSERVGDTGARKRNRPARPRGKRAGKKQRRRDKDLDPADGGAL